MFSPSSPIVIPPMVSIFTRGIGITTNAQIGTVPASGTWESANRAVYYPVVLPASCVVKRVWWANGATVSGGANIAVGVYADSGSYSPGAKLVSGSAVQGNANEVQFVDVTDTSLPAGPYWIAIASDSATNTTLMRSVVGSASIDAALRFNETAAYPLPATATPTESAITNLWLCGFSTTASP